MNKTSLLDNLLATTGANPAVNKKKPVNNAADRAGDAFRDTLQQLRPKVAAPRPERAPAQAAPAKARVQPELPEPVAHSSKPAVERPDSTLKREPAVNTKRTEQADKTSTEAASSRTALKNEQTRVKDEKAATAAEVADNRESATEEVAFADAPVSALAADEEFTPAGISLESLISAAALELTPGDSDLQASEPAIDESAETLDSAVSDLSPLLQAALLQPAPLADGTALSAAGMVANPLSTAVSLQGALNSSGLSPMSSSVLVGSQGTDGLAGQSGLQLANALATIDANAGGEASASDLLANSSLVDNPSAGNSVAGSSVAGNSVAGSPEQLLLNAKALMSKLAEASSAAADKPAADAIKTLTTGAPAVEALSRMSEAQSPAARSFVVQTGVPVTLGQPQWGQAVGEKVLWLAAQNVSAAEIRLDPPELGPMQVRVSLHQEQVNVSFTSPHPVVRDALDQQLNRLREMFAEQGLNLVNVDVSDKSFARQEQERRESSQQGGSSRDDEELTPVATTSIASNRLVDHYA